MEGQVLVGKNDDAPVIRREITLHCSFMGGASSSIGGDAGMIIGTQAGLVEPVFISDSQLVIISLRALLISWDGASLVEARNLILTLSARHEGI